MTYAHQGVEIKPLPGLSGPAPAIAQVAAAPAAAGEAATPRPTMLNRRSIDVLLRVERMMDNATRALADAPLPNVTPGQRAGAPLPGAIAAAETSAARGN
jgi:penicillin-binding protein 1A